MAIRLPGSRREEEVAARRRAASRCRGPSPGGRGTGEAASSVAVAAFAEAGEGGGGEEEENGKGQERCRCCCLLPLFSLLSFGALLELASAEAEAAAEVQPLFSPRSALAAAASGAGKSAKILSPSTLLIISVIVEEVGHAKLVSELPLPLRLEALAAACCTCDAVCCAERASAAPSDDQLPATVSAVSSRASAAALAALCRESWAVLRDASNSRACFFVFVGVGSC